MARACLHLAKVEAGRESYTAAAGLCARALSYLDSDKDRRLWALAKQNAASYTIAARDILRARTMFCALPPVRDRWMELRRF